MERKRVFSLGLCSLSDLGKIIRKGPQKNKILNSHHGAGDLVTWDELDRVLKSSDKLCTAYRETQDEKLAGIRKAIYASSATVGLVVSVVQIGLHFYG